MDIIKHTIGVGIDLGTSRLVHQDGKLVVIGDENELVRCDADAEARERQQENPQIRGEQKTPDNA